MDPLADFFEDQSPYAYVHNNPILFNDPLGLEDSLRGRPGEEPARMLDVTVSTTVKKSNNTANSSGASSGTSATFEFTGSEPTVAQIPIPRVMPPIIPVYNPNKSDKWDEAGPLGINWLAMARDLTQWVSKTIDRVHVWHLFFWSAFIIFIFI